jgi:hypothetical protein
MHAPNREGSNDWEHLVRDRVRGLRFGTVSITVHQGRVTLVEATEKIRLEESVFPSRRSPTYRSAESTNDPVENPVGATSQG